MTPSRPTSTVPFDLRTPIPTPSSSPASTIRWQQHHQYHQHHPAHERLPAPVPVLMEALRTLMALPSCDVRMAAAAFRATRYLFRAARGPKGGGAVVEAFDYLVRIRARACVCASLHILVGWGRSLGKQAHQPLYPT